VLLPAVERRANGDDDDDDRDQLLTFIPVPTPRFEVCDPSQVSES
jgi:hypothetical protein